MSPPRVMRPACERIGARLARARQDAGLTQEQVAAASGLTRPSIANIEAGRQDVTLSRLLLIVGAVRADPSHIIRAVDVYARLETTR